MHSATAAAIGYSGKALGVALNMLPHIEALGFDGKEFMSTVVADLQGMGVMRNGPISGGQDVSVAQSSPVQSVVQNSGQGLSLA